MEIVPEHWSNWASCQAPAEEGECGAPTKGGVRYRPLGIDGYVDLCDEHRTLEIARDLVPRATQLTYS
jgi:hypothetical protein